MLMKPRRFLPASPEKRPLKEVVTNGTAVELGRPIGQDQAQGQDGAMTNEAQKNGNGRHETVYDHEYSPNPMGDEDENGGNDSDNQIEEALSFLNTTAGNIDDARDGNHENDDRNKKPHKAVSVSPEKATSRPEKQAASHGQQSRSRQPDMKASRSQKRKPEEISEEARDVSRPRKTTKKSRTTKESPAKEKPRQKIGPSVGREFTSGNNLPSGYEPSKNPSTRIVGMEKDTNTHLSRRQQAELDQIIEKVKARPGKVKSLYVLKREKTKKTTAAAEDVRAGRATVKPLAYWSAEQCVHDAVGDDGPGIARLELGSRVPLSSSIKEVHPKQRLRAAYADRGGEDSDSSDSGSDPSGPNTYRPDGHEEPWETEIGVYRGQTTIWRDPNRPRATTSDTDDDDDDDEDDEERETTEMTELAYHPTAILTQKVGGPSSFPTTASNNHNNNNIASGATASAAGPTSNYRYAKLISLPFFGGGIVDLAPGTVKAPKNSRAMHLCFFVVRGRVTVRIGGSGSGSGNGMGGNARGLGRGGNGEGGDEEEEEEEEEEEVFSIGKGGVFQVPRGEFLLSSSAFFFLFSLSQIVSSSFSQRNNPPHQKGQKRVSMSKIEGALTGTDYRY